MNTKTFVLLKGASLLQTTSLATVNVAIKNRGTLPLRILSSVETSCEMILWVKTYILPNTFS